MTNNILWQQLKYLWIGDTILRDDILEFYN